MTAKEKKKCEDCIFLTGGCTGVGIECQNPNKEWRTPTAHLKPLSAPACKMFKEGVNYARCRWEEYQRQRHKDLYGTDLKERKKRDMVEVVRCKDCKYWDTMPSSTSAPELRECSAHVLKTSTKADDYCSYGERKKDD